VLEKGRLLASFHLGIIVIFLTIFSGANFLAFITMPIRFLLGFFFSQAFANKFEPFIPDFYCLRNLYFLSHLKTPLVIFMSKNSSIINKGFSKGKRRNFFSNNEKDRQRNYFSKPKNNVIRTREIKLRYLAQTESIYLG